MEKKGWSPKIRPHRRCWGVIVRMALVKGYRFTWGGGISRPKPPVFDRSWRSPSKNTVNNSTEDTCSWTRPSKIGKRKVKKPRVFQLFDLNFLVCNIFFCGSAGGLDRRRIFEFLDPFSDWFSSFCDSRNIGFYSVFLFSACLTASFKTSKNLINYAVLCYGVNENIVNTSVFWRWLKKHCKLQCFWPPDPQKQWYLQWCLLLTAQKHCKQQQFRRFFMFFVIFWTALVRYTWLSNSSRFFSDNQYFRMFLVSMADIIGSYERSRRCENNIVQTVAAAQGFLSRSDGNRREQWQ